MRLPQWWSILWFWAFFHRLCCRQLFQTSSFGSQSWCGLSGKGNDLLHSVFNLQLIFVAGCRIGVDDVRREQGNTWKRLSKSGKMGGRTAPHFAATSASSALSCTSRRRPKIGSLKLSLFHCQHMLATSVFILRTYSTSGSHNCRYWSLLQKRYFTFAPHSIPSTGLLKSPSLEVKVASLSSLHKLRYIKDYLLQTWMRGKAMSVKSCSNCRGSNLHYVSHIGSCAAKYSRCHRNNEAHELDSIHDCPTESHLGEQEGVFGLPLGVCTDTRCSPDPRQRHLLLRTPLLFQCTASKNLQTPYEGLSADVSMPWQQTAVLPCAAWHPVMRTSCLHWPQ